MPEDYALLVNDERTVMVRIWLKGPVEVCLRDDPDHTWSAPIIVKPE